MKFEANGEVAYTRTEELLSVSVMPYTSYVGKESVQSFVVEVTAGSSMPIRILETTNKQTAEKMRDMIGAEIEKVKPAETYLDGFKAGTEYALKLMKADK